MKKGKSFSVKHEDKEMQVLIPDTGDSQEMEYLEQAEREKTLDELKRKPSRKQPRFSKEDTAEAIKDWKERLERKCKRTVGRYFSADYSS